MTTFWQHIQAASQYVTGNVWDLITHPKLGGGGGSIVADAITLRTDPGAVMTINDSPVVVVFPDLPTMTVAATGSITLTTTDQITLRGTS